MYLGRVWTFHWLRFLLDENKVRGVQRGLIPPYFFCSNAAFHSYEL